MPYVSCRGLRAVGTIVDMGIVICENIYVIWEDPPDMPRAEVIHERRRRWGEYFQHVLHNNQFSAGVLYERTEANL